jgi:hypothetical protein
VDEKKPELRDTILAMLPEDIYYSVETHGGYHVIVRKTDNARRIIHNQILPLATPLPDGEGGFQRFQDGNKWRYKMNITYSRQVQTPIPGLLHGGVEVKFLGGCLE